MSIVIRLSKRKRVEELVKRSIENAERADNYMSTTGLSIMDVVRSFTELWPTTYFSTADDRKIAGLVLAYMMEISEIDIDEANELGFQLLRFTADVDTAGFSQNAPYTYAELHQRIMAQTQEIPLAED